MGCIQSKNQVSQFQPADPQPVSRLQEQPQPVSMVSHHAALVPPFLREVAPDGTTWAHYVKAGFSSVDTRTTFLAGPWAECISSAVTFQRAGDWALLSEYEGQDGPVAGVLAAFEASLVDRPDGAELLRAAYRFEEAAHAAAQTGLPMPGPEAHLAEQGVCGQQVSPRPALGSSGALVPQPPQLALLLLPWVAAPDDVCSPCVSPPAPPSSRSLFSRAPCVAVVRPFPHGGYWYVCRDEALDDQKIVQYFIFGICVVHSVRQKRLRWADTAAAAGSEPERRYGNRHKSRIACSRRLGRRGWWVQPG
mmetsp:Transcript_80286/g.222045  ORF Transcript_80286/g.222045 Transcript_80286/m.222045 type:complete len:306 (-) Transcript_80286:413-1330(-)